MVPARPKAGPNFEILAVPDRPGGTERFVIVYESIEAGGRHDIRILALELYGTHPGLRPFPATSGDRRLEDAGLIVRGGRAWIAVLAVGPRLEDSLELFYTESSASQLA
jgi:hypothetical protein